MRLKQVFDRELVATDDLSEGELAELREIERRQERGEDTYVSMEEAMRMAHEAVVK